MPAWGCSGRPDTQRTAQRDAGYPTCWSPWLAAGLGGPAGAATPTGTAEHAVALSCWSWQPRRCWSAGSGPLPVFGLVLAVNLAAGLAVNGHAINGAALLIALYTVAVDAAAPGRAGRAPACSRWSWSPRLLAVRGRQMVV